MAKKWIKSAIKRPGALKAKAKSAGKSVKEYVSDVSNKPDKYSDRTKKQVMLSKTLKKIVRKRNKM